VTSRSSSPRRMRCFDPAVTVIDEAITFAHTGGKVVHLRDHEATPPIRMQNGTGSSASVPAWPSSRAS
jgi:hypothetical protein